MINSKDVLKSCKFPIISISTDKSTIRFNNHNDLITCGSLALKRKYYENLKIIDSEGSVFVVQKAEKKKNNGFFWGYDIFLTKNIIVNLYAVKTETIINIEYLKEIVKKLINKEKYFYESSGYSYDEYKDYINKSSTIEEVMLVFTDKLPL